MTFAAPIKVVDPPRGLGHRRGDRRAVDPRRQGAGGLLRRDPADDRDRHLHHQRHRARHRQPAPPLARASSSITTRARRTRAASCSTPRASSRTAARGSTSSSTTRTSSTSASTAAGSCTRPCSSARSATRREELLNYFYDDRDDLPREGRASTRESVELRAARRPARDARHQASEDRAKSSSRRTASSRKAAIKKLQEAKRRAPADRRRRARRQGRPRTTSSTRRPARSSSSATRSSPRTKLDELREARHRAVQGPLHRRPQRRPVPPRHAARRQGQDARRGDHGDLPAPAPGRSADARDGEDALQQPVLQPRALRPLEGRPPQAELQVLRTSNDAALDTHVLTKRRTSSRRSATSSS